ncbi:uncharacterized protein LOC128157856 [Crassostrea angulata]|uniref:uncharacterized protein LOC128157856 n=1 Tax=Magallana angulata TaxID=2784310 RepID=UPI0022B1D1AD|nr:uncharacterized protein LOC128157856 [Crassostrea angulata]
MTVREFMYHVALFLWIIYTKGILGRCTSNDTGGALQVNGRCYWMIREHLIFTDAPKRCQEDGGILAEIPDTETQNAVEGFFLSLSTNYWIGVHDIYRENYFVNMLNETVLQTKWAASQPNNVHYKYKNADCVEMASNGWVDVPCTLSMSAICSKRNNVIVTSSQLSTIPETTITPTSTTPAIVTTSPQPITTTPMTTPTTKIQSQITTFTSESSTRAVFTEPYTRTQISESQTTTPAWNVDEITTSKEQSCLCPCSRTKNQVYIENVVELRIKVDKLKKELYVNKSLLASSIRKRTSAVDRRPSASIVGGTLSIVIIAIVVGLITLGDVGQLLQFFWKMICGYSHR